MKLLRSFFYSISNLKKELFLQFQLAGMNRKLNNNIETIFLMSDVENQIISSKFVKEIIKLKGDIKKFTTKSTIKLLKKKYE